MRWVVAASFQLADGLRQVGNLADMNRQALQEAFSGRRRDGGSVYQQSATVVPTPLGPGFFFHAERPFAGLRAKISPTFPLLTLFSK
jgi:hypothetical protein